MGLFVTLPGDRKLEISFRHDHIESSEACGHTICAVKDDQHRPLSFGLSACSKKDQYQKVTGRKVALTRAIRCFPKTDRRVIWSQYLNRSTRRQP